MTKIILVDDEKIILNSLSGYIKKELPDFEILGCFRDGRKALDFLIEHPVDVILTDICMPRMDGLELAREICNRMPHCVVVILSGFSEFEYARNAIKYNVFNYMIKPLDYRELKRVLIEAGSTAASRQKPMSSSDLSEEATEMFFVDLFCGSLLSVRELQERFLSLNLPFSMDETKGYQLRLTLKDDSLMADRHYEIDRLVFSLKNMLYFSIADTHFYFMRKASLNYYYIAIGSCPPGDLECRQLEANVREFLELECTVVPYHPFSSFQELVRKGDETVLAASPHAEQSTDALIQKAMEYIHSNYNRNLSRETVADTVYLSPSHFSFLFKQKTGINFMDYLTTVRMQKSIELLKTKMRINDIAEKIGYQTRNRFIINFRQYTGYTPTEYRRNILSMEDTPDEK